MKRTTTRRRREAVAFVRDNRRLFPFVGLFLVGVAVGVAVYTAAPAETAADFGAMLRVPAIEGGLRQGLGALWGSCFSTVLFLCGLYLLGLWACGAPFAFLVPLLHGLGLGLTEAYYYSLGGRGVLTVAVVILPAGLLNAAILVMAGAQTVRLSARLTRRLLPPSTGGETQGGLWEDFRLYSLRFLLCLAGAVAVGLLDVLLRVLCSGHLL